MWNAARLGSGSCRRSPCSSASMSFQSAIPWQVALRQSPPPLHRLETILHCRTMIFQRTATTPLPPCLSLRVHSSPFPRTPIPEPSAISSTTASCPSSLETRLAGDENTSLFLGMVKPQPGDKSMVENAGTFLMWYDTFYISVDSRPCSAQTSFESPFLKRARSFRGVLCIAHHFVAAWLLPTKKFSLSTAARLRAKPALPSCEVTESRCMKSTTSRQHDFSGNLMSTIS
jgi:hypothetical protein